MIFKHRKKTQEQAPSPETLQMASEAEMAAGPARSARARIRTGDFATLIVVAFLVVFGIIMVFSASYYFSIGKYGDPYHYLKSDLMWAGLSTCALAFFALFDYHIWYKAGTPLLVFGYTLLVLVLTSLGETRNNAARWIVIPGTSVTIMPGEIMKFCMILFMAYYLDKYPKAAHPKERPVGFILALAIVGGAALLILKQPNLSTAILVVMIAFFMMIVAGLHWGWLLGGIAGGLAGVFALVKFAPKSYWTQRIISFTDPFADKLDTGWQVVQSIYALASGGLKGAGLGNSVEKALYLPEPQNDFILAIIGEELGFIGCVLLLAVYVFLIWRCTRIAINAPDRYGTLLASGITIMLALQVLMNYAVVTSSMPNTGVSLPFVSYGGNSLLIFMSLMGILYNISRQSDLGGWDEPEDPESSEMEESNEQE